MRRGRRPDQQSLCSSSAAPNEERPHSQEVSHSAAALQEKTAESHAAVEAGYPFHSPGTSRLSKTDMLLPAFQVAFPVESSPYVLCSRPAGSLVGSNGRACSNFENNGPFGNANGPTPAGSNFPWSALMKSVPRRSHFFRCV